MMMIKVMIKKITMIKIMMIHDNDDKGNDKGNDKEDNHDEGNDDP